MLDKQKLNSMEKVFYSLVRSVKRYLIFKKISQIFEALIFLSLLYYFFVQNTFIGNLNFTSYPALCITLCVLIEILFGIYRMLINKEISEAENIFKSEFDFHKKQSLQYKAMLDGILSHENDEQLTESQKKLIEKEKNLDGYLSIHYVTEKIYYSAAHMNLRKINKLKKAVLKSKKWW
jgi:hypothetical protein